MALYTLLLLFLRTFETFMQKVVKQIQLILNLHACNVQRTACNLRYMLQLWHRPRFPVMAVAEFRGVVMWVQNSSLITVQN